MPLDFGGWTWNVHRLPEAAHFTRESAAKVRAQSMKELMIEEAKKRYKHKDV
ncbi:MAG: hypothetical protein R3C68_14350 [Myxococcota bacterium]